jgi:DNA-binding LytR/AlgR family response regulator
MPKMSSTNGLPRGGTFRHFEPVQVYARFILAIVDSAGSSNPDVDLPTSAADTESRNSTRHWRGGPAYFSALINRHGKLLTLVTGTTIAWLATVMLFAFCAWIDQSVRGSSTAPLSVYMTGWAKGMAPWLVLGPMVFRWASSSRHENLVDALRSGLICGALCMTVIAVYAALVFSYGTERTPLEALAAFRLTDWMWDVTFFVLLIMTGRLTRQPAVVRVSTSSESGSLAVKSHDRVEYIQISDIQGATAQGNYIALHLPGRDVLHRVTMASLTKNLTAAGFVRIHRSHLANPDLVVSATARGERVREVRLKNGIELPVSERYSYDVGTRLADRVCA